MNIYWDIRFIYNAVLYAEEVKEYSYLGYNDETEILEILEELIEDEIAIEIKRFDETGIIISEGILGAEVLRVKRFFKEKGYSNINEDYHFDSRLKDVILKLSIKSWINSKWNNR